MIFVGACGRWEWRGCRRAVLSVAPAARRVGQRSTGGDGQRAEPGECRGHLSCPGPGALNAEPTPALSAGKAGGEVRQPVAHRLWFGLGDSPCRSRCWVAAMTSTASMTTVSQAVLIATRGEVVEPGVLRGASGPRPGRARGVGLRGERAARRGVGGEGGVAPAVVLLERVELRTRVRRSRRTIIRLPTGYVAGQRGSGQHAGNLGQTGAVTVAAVGVDRVRPDSGGDGGDRGPFLVPDCPADGCRTPALRREEPRRVGPVRGGSSRSAPTGPRRSNAPDLGYRLLRPAEVRQSQVADDRVEATIREGERLCVTGAGSRVRVDTHRSHRGTGGASDASPEPGLFRPAVTSGRTRGGRGGAPMSSRVRTTCLTHRASRRCDRSSPRPTTALKPAG